MRGPISEPTLRSDPAGSPGVCATASSERRCLHGEALASAPDDEQACRLAVARPPLLRESGDAGGARPRHRKGHIPVAALPRGGRPYGRLLCEAAGPPECPAGRATAKKRKKPQTFGADRRARQRSVAAPALLRRFSPADSCRRGSLPSGGSSAGSATRTSPLPPQREHRSVSSMSDEP